MSQKRVSLLTHVLATMLSMCLVGTPVHAASQSAPNTRALAADPAWQRLASPADRAEVLVSLGAYQDAVALLKQWQPSSESDWLALDLGIAGVFRALGQPEKVEAYLDEAQTRLSQPNAKIWRLRLDAQLTAKRWDAAENSLEMARHTGLVTPEVQAAWRALLSAMQPINSEAVVTDLWSDAIARWRALLSEDADLRLIAGHLINAQQTKAILGAMPSLAEGGGSPAVWSIKATLAKRAGDDTAARAAHIQAATGYQKAGNDVAYLIQRSQANLLTSEETDVGPANDTTPLQAIESRDMRLTRRGAFLQESQQAVPYFKPLSPKSFERFPFPGGTAVRGASGVVVDGGRRVLTNRHVVEGGSDFAVRTGLGEVSKARVVFMSETDDLAILELDKPLPAARAIELSDLRMAQPGSQVVAMGYPLWYLLGSQTPSLTNGVVAKVAGINEDPKMFQLTAKINRGNSGGPVFDMRGHLVGLTMGKLDNEALRLSEGIMPEDINFAIQADRIRQALTGRIDPVANTNATADLAVKPPEQIYQDMLGRVVIVAVAVK